MSEPTTAAGRRLLYGWERDPKELWLVERVTAAIVAIEKEAQALDVETLARAIGNRRDIAPYRPSQERFGMVDRLDYADAIAVEYQRLVDDRDPDRVPDSGDAS